MGLAGWIIAILALLLAVCAGALIVYKRNLLKVRRSLENLRRTQSNGRLRLSVPDRALERLLEEVNALLDERQASDALHRRQERQRRQEIANISHDLRTPLTSILGYLQMIKSESTTPEERAEYLAIVESRAHALKALVTGFYDLSCLEAGGYALAQESVALAPLLVELAAAFYADFNADGREAEIDIAEGLSPILGDPQAVLRIYTNLFQNAIKHGAGDLYIRAFQEDGVVVTCFTNLAPGLLPQDVEHLFDRFFTADRMRTGQDTGLGLAIVHRLAMQMGGETEALLLQNKLTITVRWPAVKPPEGRR